MEFSLPKPDIPVPKEVRDSVIQEIYRQVEEVDWEDLSDRDKSAHYARWVADAKIGDVLADYYTADGMRVWLKDTPLKEYARAVEDFGPFAKYTQKRLTPPTEFVPPILGARWRMVPGSIREKPMHCVFTDGSEERYVCWGKPRSFSILLWAAVNNAVTTHTRPLIVVFLRAGKPIDEDQKVFHEKIASHCSLDMTYVHRHLEVKP
ncbi:hypothetical protein ACFORH_24720 [Amycolatopsis roodepoortensis]|uniref:Uncharacterized protein n=1 Tax=Amycolatopsis roodepoortensis TaxID=700274 RepID=A0ABR9LKN5_9PSEU|nr:hypothetical protein [Amycolatopsis roodepoortensis]MBE1581152.1 hypothetical protein [Amycolatopsis roodepoortensis]